ncbi:hypothetical protein B0H11DRAFT_2042946 [Mycena galericulata]|nr:hypothetical protein B0H11DRAFT_2042946 [Mycena galericulata]
MVLHQMESRQTVGRPWVNATISNIFVSPCGLDSVDICHGSLQCACSDVTHLLATACAACITESNPSWNDYAQALNCGPTKEFPTPLPSWCSDSSLSLLFHILSSSSWNTCYSILGLCSCHVPCLIYICPFGFPARHAYLGRVAFRWTKQQPRDQHSNQCDWITTARFVNRKQWREYHHSNGDWFTCICTVHSKKRLVRGSNRWNCDRSVLTGDIVGSGRPAQMLATSTTFHGLPNTPSLASQCHNLDFQRRRFGRRRWQHQHSPPAVEIVDIEDVERYAHAETTRATRGSFAATLVDSPYENHGIWIWICTN